MTIPRRIAACGALACLVLLPPPAMSHEPNHTHAALGQASVWLLGNPLIDAPAAANIVQGTVDEDACPNYYSHFFNPRTGEIVYGFIHGNWALCNSRPDGRWCGVNDELTVLRQTGCYADFTMPSAPGPTQTLTTNRIYYARDDPNRPRSHDTGLPVGMGHTVTGALLLVQGPLILNWHNRKWGILPRLESGCIQGSQPPDTRRVDLWLRARVQVASRPDWYFVKLHTHGANEANMEALLGAARWREASQHRFLRSVEHPARLGRTAVGRGIKHHLQPSRASPVERGYRRGDAARDRAVRAASRAGTRHARGHQPDSHGDSLPRTRKRKRETGTLRNAGRGLDQYGTAFLDGKCRALGTDGGGACAASCRATARSCAADAA